MCITPEVVAGIEPASLPYEGRRIPLPHTTDPQEGIEPSTSPVPRECSATVLLRRTSNRIRTGTTWVEARHACPLNTTDAGDRRDSNPLGQGHNLPCCRYITATAPTQGLEPRDRKSVV